MPGERRAACGVLCATSLFLSYGLRGIAKGG
jgi:hypothetical protein